MNTKKSPREEKVIEAVQSQVTNAAAELRSLGPKMEKVAWLLEDALGFIDEPEEVGRAADFKAELEAVTQASLIANLAD